MDRRQFLSWTFSLATANLFASHSASSALPIPRATRPQNIPPAIPKHKQQQATAFYLGQNKILTVNQLPVGKAYLFFYPLVCTPALLINVGKVIRPLQDIRYKTAFNEEYSFDWSGGAGPQNSLVAYSAICPHDLIYPTKELNLLSYRHKRAGYYTPQDNLITCCGSGSAYDVTKGGHTVQGASKKNLSSITLQYDPQTTTLAPQAIQGYNVIPSFLRKHRKTLRKTFGKNYHASVKGKIILTPLDHYAAKTVKC